MPEQMIDFDSNPPVATSEYDLMAQMVLPGYEAMHDMALSVLRSRLPEKTNLLIVGAGTGMELVKFSKSNSQWQMLGVDPSSNMLAIANQKIEQHGLSERVKLRGKGTGRGRGEEKKREKRFDCHILSPTFLPLPLPLPLPLRHS